MTLPIQPTLNLGIVGHVDHGKTTLTKTLSGKWTDTHSEEMKRGITIKLGYTNFSIYENKENNSFSIKNENNGREIRRISIVDAPGHESFMATMISGSAVMDCALLVIAANEKCPQPQTFEHLKTLEIAGIKDIIVIQNKVDLVTKEEALENFRQIKNFLKGTIAENSDIIPISAHHGANISELLRSLLKIKEPERNLDKNPHMLVIRSFDINKPGMEFSKISGGVLGGSIQEGKLKVGDEIEIRPGLMQTKGGKTIFEPIYAKVKAMKTDKDSIEEAIPGGSIAIMTDLDPSLTKSDTLVGQVGGLRGKLPEPKSEITFEPHLLEKVITSEKEFEIKSILPNEALMLIVNSLATVGIVSKANPKEISMKLKRPIMSFKDDRAVLFRRFEGNKWRIIGYGVIKQN